MTPSIAESGFSLAEHLATVSGYRPVEEGPLVRSYKPYGFKTPKEMQKASDLCDLQTYLYCFVMISMFLLYTALTIGLNVGRAGQAIAIGISVISLIASSYLGLRSLGKKPRAFSKFRRDATELWSLIFALTPGWFTEQVTIQGKTLIEWSHSSRQEFMEMIDQIVFLNFVILVKETEFRQTSLDTGREAILQRIYRLQDVLFAFDLYLCEFECYEYAARK